MDEAVDGTPAEAATAETTEAPPAPATAASPPGVAEPADVEAALAGFEADLQGFNPVLERGTEAQVAEMSETEREQYEAAVDQEAARIADLEFRAWIGERPNRQAAEVARQLAYAQSAEELYAIAESLVGGKAADTPTVPDIDPNNPPRLPGSGALYDGAGNPQNREARWEYLQAFGNAPLDEIRRQGY